MKRLFCLLLVSAFLLSFTDVKSPDAKKLEPRRTVIAGVVENYTDDTKVLVVNFCDVFSDTFRFSQDLTESDGHFHAEHDYIFAQDMSINVGGRMVPVLISPGDSIFINFDVSKLHTDFPNAVRFSGDNVDINNELTRWAHYRHQLNRSLPLDIDCPNDQLLDNTRKNFEMAKSGIDAYAQRYGMSETFKKWAFIDYRFFKANDFHGRGYASYDWALLTDPVYDVFDDDNLQAMIFYYHLIMMYRSALKYHDVEIKELIAAGQRADAIRVMIDRVHEKAPEGMVRDVMLCMAIMDELIKTPELLDSIPDIKTAFSNEIFVGELEKTARKSIYKRTEKIKIPDNERISTGSLYLNGNEIENIPDGKIMNYLSERYKDKVIYLDIWAVWCPGCITTFEDHTPELYKHFEKRDDVVFVNLCLSSKMEYWIKIINDKNVGGENYLLDSIPSKLFIGDYNVPGFPTYMIIDKNGILHYSAPNPGDLPEAIKKIESLLQ